MSQAESHLPVDMRKSSGVGGGARENKSAAAAHSAAVTAASGQQPEQEQKAKEGDKAEVKAEATVSECPHCKVDVTSDDNFCSKCGNDLLADPAKKLGISFAEEDLDMYLFNGHVVKEVKLVGRSLELRSSVSGDLKQISDYLMKEWADKEVTPEFWENLRSTAAVTLAIDSFDGKIIGETVKERVEWMLSMGSALSDMIVQRVVLFNRAVTDWLAKKNTFLAY